MTSAYGTGDVRLYTRDVACCCRRSGALEPRQGVGEAGAQSCVEILWLSCWCVRGCCVAVAWVCGLWLRGGRWNVAVVGAW
eukprot:scaffold22671_cov118-Isochrysis_galbana.AAC.3